MHADVATLRRARPRNLRWAHRAGSVILAGVVAYISFRLIHPHSLVTLGLAAGAFFCSELFNCWERPRVTQAWHDLMYPGDATDFFARREMPAFDPDVVGYNAGNALQLMELSRLVYRHDIEEDSPPPQPTRKNFLAQAGFRQIKFFASQETDTQSMLVESITQPRYAVLVFRGTEQNPKDFFTDLSVGAPTLGRSEINVHEGFKKALDARTASGLSVWQEIETELLKLDCPVFYTGHSLGAALATLAAARLAPKAVYTFGSPRVGNQAFVDSLGSLPIHRVVDGEDIVTTVPPSEIFGYQHAGATHQLPRPQSSFGHRLKNLCLPPGPLADHTPINYVDRIAIP